MLFISRGKRDSPGSVGVANGGGPSEKAARGKIGVGRVGDIGWSNVGVRVAQLGTVVRIIRARRRL